MKILKVVVCCALAVVACGCGKKKHESSSSSSGGGGWFKLPSFSAKSDATSMAQNGRKLFVAIMEANTMRSGKGMPSVWPKSADDMDEDAEDIAGKDFTTSTQYFNELFDMANYGGKDRRSHLGDLDLSVLKIQGEKALSAATGRRLTASDVDWCVLKGVREEMEDIIPVLVSANVNVDDLPVSGEFDGRSTRRVRLGRANGAAKDLFGNKFAIIVRKGGAVQFFEPKYAKLNQIYRNTPFSIPSDARLEYLKP